ncbi:helix-turn-helix domain-containing protein [Sinorhizobium fredii]|uniref:helix-turn-helix domain-containing protein n=1 Tax=Rhizobium fredii TaxID=380 RepID=UPI0035186F22
MQHDRGKRDYGQPPSDAAEQIAALIGAGMQRIEIAARLGVSRESVSRVLKGQSPTPDVARKIEALYRACLRPRNVAGPPLNGKLGNWP